jgi:holo-[acyl-carrier protein] synthase
MNIYGIGIDIVNVNRIKLAIKKSRNFFKKKIYTNFEIKNCEKRKNNIECYAKRFAAKEALFKAVGVGNKLQFKDIEIKNNPSGAPKFNIKGNSLKNLKKIFKNKKFKIHLSLSDDKPWAIASVIIFLYR